MTLRPEHKMGALMALLFLAGWFLGSHAWSHVEPPVTHNMTGIRFSVCPKPGGCTEGWHVDPPGTKP